MTSFTDTNNVNLKVEKKISGSVTSMTVSVESGEELTATLVDFEKGMSRLVLPDHSFLGPCGQVG